MKNEATLDLLRKLGFPKENVKICIETGTHRGYGVETFVSLFDKVYSVELAKDLYEFCKEQFKDNAKVELFNGPSPEFISSIVPNINSKYFLFLDAHGSGGDTTFDNRVGRLGSPVLDEIQSCLANPRNLPEFIVIDDLSDFIDLATYPKPNQIIEKVKELGEYSNHIIEGFKGWLVFEKIRS